MADPGGFPTGARGKRFAFPEPSAGGEDEFKHYSSVLLPLDVATYTEMDQHGEEVSSVFMDYPGRAKVQQRINTSQCTYPSTH